MAGWRYQQELRISTGAGSGYPHVSESNSLLLHRLKSEILTHVTMSHCHIMTYMTHMKLVTCDKYDTYIIFVTYDIVSHM